MKKILFGLMISIAALTACMSQTPTEPPSFIVEQPNQDDLSSGEGLSSVEYAVVKQLAGNLGLKINDIIVLENKATEFNDACLGVFMEDVMCAQVVTSGHSIVLEANGTQYEYHTSEDGSRIQPASLALTYKREGGIAGFCDSLTVFLSGEIYGNQCKSQPSGVMETFASVLTASERSQFTAWINKYGQVTLDASDPKGMADGMSLVIEIFGNGNGKPGKPIQQEMFTWAQELFNELYK